MANTSSVDAILEFLRKNKFTTVEAALRTDLRNSPDLDGFLRKLSLEEKDVCTSICGEKAGSPGALNQILVAQNGSEVSKELVVKEIDYRLDGNDSQNKLKNTTSMKIESRPNDMTKTAEKGLAFSRGSEENMLDQGSWNFNQRNGPSYDYQNRASSSDNFPEISEQTVPRSIDVLVDGEVTAKSGEDIILMGEKRSLWIGRTGKVNAESKNDKSPARKYKEGELQVMVDSTHGKDQAVNTLWSRSDELVTPSLDLYEGYKTVLPCPTGDGLNRCSDEICSDTNAGNRKAKMCDGRVASKKQEGDGIGCAWYLGEFPQSSNSNEYRDRDLPLLLEAPKEELPRLRPVKLKSEDKLLAVNWEEKYDQEGPDATGANRCGGNWLSVSQGIAEDISDLVSGFATIGDELSESIDYPNEYWDSDEYDDDDDVGYTRQPIEDEAWFLAHEIDYPSDSEKVTRHGSVVDGRDRGQANVQDDDDQSFEEDCSLSGVQYFQSKNNERVTASDDHLGFSVVEVHGRTDEGDLNAGYSGQLIDEEELNLMCGEPVWHGLLAQSNELVMLRDEKIQNHYKREPLDDMCMDNDRRGLVRSIGVGINNDAAEVASEQQTRLTGAAGGGDFEYFHDHKKVEKTFHDGSNRNYERVAKCEPERYVVVNGKHAPIQEKTLTDQHFTLYQPMIDEHLVPAGCSKPSLINTGVVGTEAKCLNTSIGIPDAVVNWKRKSSDSSTVKSFEDEDQANAERSVNSSPSSLLSYNPQRELATNEGDDLILGINEEVPGESVEDEEAAAVQEQLRQIRVQEEEFETFELKIVHRKNRTGFEEDKNFQVVLNSVIAGRYHVTEYLGSAAFSKAIQAHDLQTGMDVCVKIIKNNKDFFDQSLDEIKLLKYINKNDPADKYHILRLYDYFYYREHLLIVCELLKANLYEFQKFNRESGGEVYFTMPRLQSITIQCLEALQFLHGLGLIHCDLKPENILVKSYSRCEVKVIDLGSSCFETDNLCSYVQSRSYRAPEVILGLPYNQKIDIWSLGCILAELCSGNVLFQNDSLATLLARVIGIIGPIDPNLLAKGKDAHKYFTKNHMLYEKNQETNRLEYLMPKKSSLRHRLPMGDQGFIEFVSYLLEVNPERRPTASEALKHPWLSFPYEPISS